MFVCDMHIGFLDLTRNDFKFEEAAENTIYVIFVPILKFYKP